jgi:PAS domain S-box-containing protein
MSKIYVKILKSLSRGEGDMNDEMILFGKKIQDSSSFLTKQVAELHDLKNTSPETDHQESYHWRKMLFLYLGNALSKDMDQALGQIMVWADIFNRQQGQPEASLKSSLYTVSYTRTVILELLENVMIQNQISSSSFIQIMKVIDPLLDQAANSLTYHFTKCLYNMKFVLSETNEDLIITLKELMNFKVALNEATIFTITDIHNRITYVNDHLCNISKYSREELIGQDHGEIFKSGYHTDEYLDNILDFIHAGKVWKGEICNRAKDGTLYWVDTTIVPFLNAEGQAYQHISIQYDITEKKKTEEMLLKSEKLSLVGELAAGLAHEIRNPLTTVKGLVQILNHSTDEKKVLYTDIILKEIDRINLIVSEFMVLAKPHAVYFSECNLIEIIKNVTYLLEAEANLKNIVISPNFVDTNLIVYGEKNQLTQVFINLFKNAMEAMPNGGTIRVSTTLLEENVHILIEDSGVGMTMEQVKKIGEPFYTTKDTGTGLGLMVSYKIIENHKGSITVKSEMNRGTTFTITIPSLNKETGASIPSNEINTY